jgi:hypothetical protein
MTKPIQHTITIPVDGPISCTNSLREQVFGGRDLSNENLRTLAVSFHIIANEIMAELEHRAVVAERQRNEAESQRIASERAAKRQVWLDKEMSKLPVYKARKVLASLDNIGASAFEDIMSMSKHYCKVHKGLKTVCKCD